MARYAEALKIELSQGGITRIDPEDYEHLPSKTLYLGTNGYAYFSIWANGKSTPYTVHSWIKPAPKGMHTDHFDGDKLNNTRANLRIVPAQINQVNRRRLNRNNKSGVRGVRLARNPNSERPWQAWISPNGSNVFLGSHAHIEDAIIARAEAELHYFGEICPTTAEALGGNV